MKESQCERVLSKCQSLRTQIGQLSLSEELQKDDVVFPQCPQRLVPQPPRIFLKSLSCWCNVVLCLIQLAYLSQYFKSSLEHIYRINVCAVYITVRHNFLGNGDMKNKWQMQSFSMFLICSWLTPQMLRWRAAVIKWLPLFHISKLHASREKQRPEGINCSLGVCAAIKCTFWSPDPKCGDSISCGADFGRWQIEARSPFIRDQFSSRTNLYKLHWPLPLHGAGPPVNLHQTSNLFHLTLNVSASRTGEEHISLVGEPLGWWYSLILSWAE